jgi:dGTPase
VLEAQAMHSKRPDAPEVKPYLDVGRPLLEAQVVDACDSLAYVCHDVDDALSVGLIALEQVAEVPFWKRAVEQVQAAHPSIQPAQLQPAVVRKLIDWQVVDLLEATRERLKSERIGSIEDVRGCRSLLVAPGVEVKSLKTGLGEFLHQNVYRHYRVLRMTHKGQVMVRQMFEQYCSHPETMPTRYRQRAESSGLQQTVCDYLAGMTDRYALEEYARLFQPTSFV